MEVRITPSVEDVLRVFLEDVTRTRFGYDLMQVTGQSSGKLYPVLRRLSDAGVLERLAPVANERSDTAPPRVPYRLRPDAIADVRHGLAEATQARRASTRRGRRQPVLRPKAAGS